jgi:predicted GNAT family acetyltransferase
MGEGGLAIEVRHEADHRRFIARVDGVDAVLDYDRHPGIIRVTHTGVPPAIGGRGVAAALVAAALDFARAEGLKVIPACSYVAAYFKRHPRDADLLVT